MSTPFDAVLIDLSGTIHIDDIEIPDSIKALKRLRSLCVKILFLTNTTKESRRILHEKLIKIGFEIEMDEICTSLSIAADYVKKNQLNPYLMLEPEAKEEFPDTFNSDINAVVIGLAPSMFNYQDLNVAFRLIMNGAQLIGIHKGRYFKKKDGLSLGPGAFVTGLEQATGKNATVLGKPEKQFFHHALQLIDCEPKRAIMIGDDYKDDIQGAMDAGLKAILVNTGKYQIGDEKKLTTQPTSVCNNFSEAVEFLMKYKE